MKFSFKELVFQFIFVSVFCCIGLRYLTSQEDWLGFGIAMGFGSALVNVITQFCRC